MALLKKSEGRMPFTQKGRVAFDFKTNGSHLKDTYNISKKTCNASFFLSGREPIFHNNSIFFLWFIPTFVLRFFIEKP
jgi:hypothetical protein